MDPWQVALQYENIADDAARRYRLRGFDRDDLYHEGLIALHAAAIAFDPSRGLTFAAWAWYRVRTAMKSATRRDSRWSREAGASDDADEPAAPEPTDAIGDDERARVLAAAGRLDARSRDVLRLRYGLDGHAPRTCREAGAELGYAHSYISRLERQALPELAAILGESTP